MINVNSFKEYLLEEQKTAYFTFGRMNPPTVDHGRLLEKLSQESGKNPYFVYLSQSQDSKSNPLSYSIKVKHARKMFPKQARSILINKSVKTPFDAMVDLHNKGFNHVVMVVGSDRVREFEILLNKYNNEKAKHGFYNFESIKVVSAGERDPDKEGVEGVSVSKQRDNVADNDFNNFSQGLPKEMTNSDARKLFNDVRKGMGLEEEKNFKNHIALEPVSEEREEYVQGKLFELGDIVVVKESEEVGEISFLGSNYIVVELSEGRTVRKWLKDVEKIEEDCWDGYKQVGMKKKGDRMVPDCVPEDKTEVSQDKDIKDRKGSQPKQYHKGLSKSTKVKRDRHFQKSAKMDDDNPDAYKPAPGDKSAKTKPSKYTKRYKRMFEEVSQKELSDLEKFADRLLNKFDIDIEFTKHFKDRMNDPRNKPAITADELKSLFKKMADNKGKRIKKHGNAQAVLKDIQSDLNLPVVVNWRNGEFEVVNKTIMRKKGFKTPNPVVKYESFEEDLTPRWVKDAIGTLSSPGNYDQALRILDNIVSRKEKENKGKLRPSKILFYAAKVANQVGVDARILAKSYDNFVREESNPLDKVRDDIEREKETDRKKHDRMLDRARIAATKRKNRETNTESFYIGESAKKALQKKADKTKYSYETLKKVYDRGVAAWRTGHRPGTTPQQWGMARVNSFVTGGKTSKTADKDLAK